MQARGGDQKLPEGERVRVLRGAYAGYVGVVEHVDPVARTIRIILPIFGRSIAVDLPYDDVEPFYSR